MRPISINEKIQIIDTTDPEQAKGLRRELNEFLGTLGKIQGAMTKLALGNTELSLPPKIAGWLQAFESRVDRALRQPPPPTTAEIAAIKQAMTSGSSGVQLTPEARRLIEEFVAGRAQQMKTGA